MSADRLLSRVLPSWLLGLVLASLSLVWSLPSHALPHGEEPANPAELALESRIFAPCCYVQTLDAHESPQASALRAEIRTRLNAGEKADAIEADLVGRFGERIRALPTESALNASMLVVAGLGALALALLGLTVRRWVRRGKRAATATPAGPRDAYDDRLDDELAQLER